MKLAPCLVLTFLLVSILPLILVGRHAFAFFHHFTREAQEQDMRQTARLMGSLFLRVSHPAERGDVLDALARESDARLRFYDSLRRLVYDSGGPQPTAHDKSSEVEQAFATGRYAARWFLAPDRSSVHYFCAEPISDEKGERIGVAQVIRDTRGITRALVRLKHNQVLATRGAALLTTALALLFAWALTRRLRRLRTAAAAYANTGDVRVFALPGNDEVSELAAAFRDMSARIERRQSFNRDFVLTTLHELKTPVTAIRGSADLLLDHPDMDPDKRCHFLRSISHQAERLSTLAADLLSLTSLDLDLPAEPLVEIPVGQLIREALLNLRSALPGDVDLIGGECATIVRAQPGRIEQVMGNLLGNAQRYQPAGKGPVRVILRGVDHVVTVTVEDDGPGIAPENIDRVFDRFFTTVPRGSARDYGRGLGLAVVKRIIEHHRGEVFARNRPEGGAAVGFMLPAAQSS